MLRRILLSCCSAIIGAGLALVFLNALVVAGSDPRELSASVGRAQGTEQYRAVTLTAGASWSRPASRSVITGGLTITDAQTYTAGLTVTDGLTVTGALTVAQGLTVSGGMHISGLLAVTGGLTAVPWDDLVPSTPETIPGGLTITDEQTFTAGVKVTGDLTVTGVMTVVGSLRVENTVTINGRLVVSEARAAGGFYTYLPMVIRNMVVPVIVDANNGDFELGAVMWDEYSTTGQTLIRPTPQLGVPAFSGQWAAQLGSRDDEISMISQGVSIRPENACLVYWQWTVSSDTCNADYGGVGINGRWADVHSLCAGTSTARWVRRQVSMTLYSTAVTSTATVLNFAVTNDYSIPSTMYVDDVSFYPTHACDLDPPGSVRAAPGEEFSLKHLIGRPIHAQNHTDLIPATKIDILSGGD